MIRSQQAQLQQYQQQNAQQPNAQSTAAIDDTPSSERSAFLPPTHAPTGPAGNRLSISSSFSNRRPSRPSSQAASPNLRPLDFGVEAFPGFSPSRRGSRDESAFYQAEASSLGRENILLRQRIRELGKIINSLIPQPAIFLRLPRSAVEFNLGMLTLHRETNWRNDNVRGICT